MSQATVPPPAVTPVLATAPGAASAPVVTPPAARTGSEFAPLLRVVREQGLLERRPWWYTRGIAVNLLGIAAVVAGLALTGPSWWALPLAVPLALLSARVAFVGHDAGHAQITTDRRIGRIVQLVHANLLLGMSRDWWNDKHNRHHAHPNHLDKDPDVAADILVFAEHQTTGRTGLRGFLTRHQARLFFPLTTLEGIALKVYGVRSLLAQDGPCRTRRERFVEGGLLLAHFTGYTALLFAFLTPAQALAFALLHHMLFGVHLGMAFAPNHKGMERPDEHPDGDSWGHLRRQVLTSRNIRGGALTDWFLGGLNYQIEHHLFPSMPRPHLRLAQSAVRAHCAALGVPYTETGFVDSYREALGHLHEVGAPLRSEGAE
ncbi:MULTISPECIES: fatty acid desaturase family protein [unclassified Streptomyces]|uniref:fatty acid desaturase family protein n=1 Tax=unclassified Streptomyces TaxID=2593676 RepID=UPI001660D1D1|nr:MULTISPECIES: acyl-CoA desaturase [unclassified Streptomyces]MBD0708846.1 acyl-CoA desaturase [Streptomyces sp. CBMA291]MBD0717020.1 acyl-CoA desaturase [Streptomyces sp. CBMA370]